MSNSGKISLKLPFFFPWFFRIPAFVGLGVSGLLILESTYGSITGIIVFLLVLTTHYRFDIDRESKEYQDYIWILGFRKGKKQSYESVDEVGIIKKKIRRTYNSRGSSSTLVHEEYEGYIQFSGQEKIELLSIQSKKKVSELMGKLSKTLNTELRDISE